LALLKRLKFGKRSEQLDAEQKALFDEAVDADIAATEDRLEELLADQLYGDSISVEPPEPSPKRANFRSFVGVAPRRYMDYFSMASNRKGDDGKILGAKDIASAPRVKRFVRTYLMVEIKMINDTVQPPQQQLIEGDPQ
jgi:hypothetical protein